MAVRLLVTRGRRRIQKVLPTQYKKGDVIGKKYEVREVLGAGGFGQRRDRNHNSGSGADPQSELKASVCLQYKATPRNQLQSMGYAIFA
jgi:hypothetical protein